MFHKLLNTFSDDWSWWWQSSNPTGDGARLLLTYALSLLFITWILVIFIKKFNGGGIKLPPGPKPLPLLGNLLSLDPELHTYFASVSKAYGPISTLWLGNKAGILISSPEMARLVLKEQDTIFANRDVPVAGKEATYGGVDIVWSPYGPEWRMLRKICVQEMLSSSTMKSVYDLRRTELKQTIKYIYNQSGSPVNIGEQMFLTVLNVITSMMWGGTVKEEERAHLGAEFRQLVAEMTGLLGMPNLSDFYPVLAPFDLQGIRKNMKRIVKRLDGIFNRMIDQRLKMEDGNENKDFLQFLLKLKDEENAKIPFTMTHVKALLMDMVVGGSDTTSNTMEFAMAEVMNKPEVLTKLQQELDTVVGKNNTVEESHIDNLPYLYAVMKEVLRLHPALPLMVPHSPSQTCSVAGYTIPKGSRVFINVWAIHRDSSIWENPLEFNPERFLQGDKKWDYLGNDFKYFPFGSGRRICAGTAMAEKMFMVLVASIIHSFDWKLADGEKLELSEKFGIVLKKRLPLVAIPTPRLSDSALYH